MDSTSHIRAKGGRGLLYAALGDSITYGYEATTDQAGYVRRFAKALSKRQPVNVFLNAKPGWTSKQLLKSLSQVPECIWAEAKVVTIMVGGNDILKASPWLLNGSDKTVFKIAQRVQDHLEQMVETVRQPGATVVIGTIYNPFPNSVLAEEYMDTVNKSILRVAEQHNLAVADVRSLFRNQEDKYIKGYKQGVLRDMRLIGNPIHPNDAGHQAIARSFLSAYRRAVAKARRSKQKA
jgi:lysophospholipase L1-like esterase